MRFKHLALILMLWVPATFANTNYKTYHNTRFGYSINYPQNILYPQGESDNGDGQEFLSKNADASLLVYGGYFVNGESLEDSYLESSRGGMTDNPNKVVTFKTKKNNWYVVSGFNSGKIFYQKTIINNDQYQTLYFEYGENQRSIYDPITVVISKSFRENETTKTTQLDIENKKTEESANKSDDNGSKSDKPNQNSFPKLLETDLYKKVVTDCEAVDLSTWSHPTRLVLENLNIKIEKVELCNHRRYPVFTGQLQYDPQYHSSNDEIIAKYFRSLWHGLLQANGQNPYAIIDGADNLIIYIKPSAEKGFVDLNYENYSD